MPAMYLPSQQMGRDAPLESASTLVKLITNLNISLGSLILFQIKYEPEAGIFMRPVISYLYGEPERH